MGNYQVPTEANIRAAVARVDAQRMMALASIGDTSPAEWTDEALNVWIGLMANVREAE